MHTSKRNTMITMIVIIIISIIIGIYTLTNKEILPPGVTMRNSINGRPITTIPQGIKVKIVDYHISHYKVKYGTNEGWIYHKYVK